MFCLQYELLNFLSFLPPPRPYPPPRLLPSYAFPPLRHILLLASPFFLIASLPSMFKETQHCKLPHRREQEDTATLSRLAKQTWTPTSLSRSSSSEAPSPPAS
eukprot:458305-Hanusia_phi.AAC.1